MSERLFKIEFDVDVFEKASAEPGRERRIGGFVSTDHLDQQSERLLQEGLDFKPFLTKGCFNDNHIKETGAAVGFPEFAELRERSDGSKGWYVEGYLLKGHRQADDIWSYATALQRAGNPRKIGYSVEGSVQERDPLDQRNIRKAVVREVAITRCPVNDKTEMLMLAKSLAVGNGSMATAPGNAAPLTQQSLEGAAPARPEVLKKKRKLGKSAAVELLMQRSPFLTKSLATRIAEYAVKHYPAKAG